ncbi:hypothetical protein EI94DRAFT_1707901 [Lactarius quietus]|nr:hypothetical protein EI94DRAFT_1707901 [Lactarius quietus]
MFSKIIPVFLLSLALSSSVVRGLPNPQVRGQKSSVSTNDTSLKGSNDESKDNGKGNTSGNTNDGSNPQTSLTLDSKLLNVASEFDGQQNITEAGQTPSQTSKNNFINFCIDKGDITNGTQNKNGSCNPIPMGQIPSIDNMPATKFQQPPNFSTVKANTNLTIKLAVANMDLGFFVNAETNYYSAPAQLNGRGHFVGHTHVCIQKLESLTSTNIVDTKIFTFFKGLNQKADQDGTVSTVVPGGVPPGAYRLSSITTGANHQSLNMPVAQRGTIDDSIYFTATEDGQSSSGSGTDDNKKSQDAKDSDDAQDKSQHTNGNVDAKDKSQSTNDNGDANSEDKSQDTNDNTNSKDQSQNTNDNANSKDQSHGTNDNSNAQDKSQDTNDNANSKDKSQSTNDNTSASQSQDTNGHTGTNQNQDTFDSSSCSVDDGPSN